MLIGPDRSRNRGEFHAVQMLLTFPQTLVPAYLIAGSCLRIAAVRGQMTRSGFAVLWLGQTVGARHLDKQHRSVAGRQHARFCLGVIGNACLGVTQPST